MVIKISDNTRIKNFVVDNNVIKGVSEEIPNKDYFGEAILCHLNSKPHHVAQIDAETGRQTTYADMKDQSIRCATWMKKQGIGRGDIAVICSDNHMDISIPIFATFYLGATYNAWNPETATKPAQRLMSLFKPKVIFACESVVDNLLEAAKLENVDTKIIVFGKHLYLQSLNEILEQQNDKEVQNFQVKKINEPDDVALIVLSSGTTGLPKGVMHSYRNISKIVTSFMAYRMTGTSLWYSTAYWITGFAFTFESLFSYGTRIIHKVFDVEATCQVIEKYKVQRFFCSGLIMTYLCKTNALKKYKLPSLKIVLAGGSQINPKIFKEFKNYLPQTVVLQSYGTSETGRYALTHTENTKNLHSTGIAASLVELKIIDLETGKVLGPNQPGELRIKSPIMMLGYYNNLEATKAAFDNDGWYCSGDKAYYDENGEFFIVDRLKEVMKYRNHHVSPTEIEEVLLSHPDVMEAAVVARSHEIDGDHATAYVKKIPGSNVTTEELVKMSEVLGKIKKLHGGVFFLDDLPKTATGKIARSVLKEKAKALAQKNDSF